MATVARHASPDRLQRRLRDACGRFATGVTVVTTLADGRIHGMTVNGFMSVSLDPPLIVVSLANRSRMRAVLERSGSYGVSVLALGQRHLSAHFAGQPGEHSVEFVDADGVPLIGGAIAHLAADVVDSHPAGDHTLFVARVRHIDMRPGEPLIFHGGGYRSLQPNGEWSMVLPGTADWL